MKYAYPTHLSLSEPQLKNSTKASKQKTSVEFSATQEQKKSLFKVKGFTSELSATGPTQLNARVFDTSLSLFQGQKGWFSFLDLEFTAGISLLGVSAESNILLGDDGYRRGIALQGGADISGISARIENQWELPIFFSPWSLTLRAKLKCSAASSGLIAGMYAYQDKETKRFWFGETGTISALLGLSEEISIGIGPKSQFNSESQS